MSLTWASDFSALRSSGRLSRQSGVPAGGVSTTGGASTTTGSGIGHLMGSEHVACGIGRADDMGHHVEAATAHVGVIGAVGIGQHLLEDIGPPARLHEHPVGARAAVHDLFQLGLGLFGGHASTSYPKAMNPPRVSSSISSTPTSFSSSMIERSTTPLGSTAKSSGRINISR